MRVVGVLGSKGMTGKAIQRLYDSNMQGVDMTGVKDKYVFCERKHADLRDQSQVERWLNENSVTHVINIAAVVGGISYNIDNPLSTLDDNLKLSSSILGACHAQGIQKVVSVLSTCIFPVRHESSFTECHIFDGKPHETNEGYAHAKRMLFALSKAYNKQHGREYVCVVPPNLYGQNDKFDHERAHVIGDLIRKFTHATLCGRTAEERKIRVYGTGAARRQFMYCDDIARILVWALDSYHDSSSPIIVADDGDITIKSLVEIIASNFPDDIAVEWDSTKPDGQLRKKALNYKFRKLYPSFQFTPLDKGIRQTVSWYISNIASLHAHQPLTPQTESITPQIFPLCDDNLLKSDTDAAVALIQSGRKLSMGKQTELLENEYGKFIKSHQNPVFVNSGSSANLLAIVAAMHPNRCTRWKRGDKIAVTALCWSTTISPLLTQGLVPVFIDVDPETLQIDLCDLEKKAIEHNDIRGIMLVHVLGSCPDMSRLMEIVHTNNWIFIEDTCEAMGNEWMGQKLGTFGDFGTFSTFYSHHMTSVEGGFILSKSESDYVNLVTMRAHGWTRNLPDKNRLELEESHKDLDPRFLFVNIGFNVRPLDICAAIGREQLKRIDEMNNIRKANMEAIRKFIDNDPRVRIPTHNEHASIAWLGIPIAYDLENGGRNITITEIQKKLEAKGVETRPIISGNFLRQPVISLYMDEVPLPHILPGTEHVHSHMVYIGLHGTKKWSNDYCKYLASHILGVYDE